jgi:hypothetical protein
MSMPHIIAYSFFIVFFRRFSGIVSKSLAELAEVLTEVFANYRKLAEVLAKVSGSACKSAEVKISGL